LSFLFVCLLYLFTHLFFSLWVWSNGYKKTTHIGGFSSLYCSETIIVGMLSLQQVVMYQQSVEIMMMVVFEFFWVSPWNANGWNAQAKNSLNQHTFPMCTISILWKTLHFFTWIFFCPKPFALAQTHLKMKDNQTANFDLMSKKDSYNEGIRSSHISIISMKYMVGTCLWSWVFIFAQPNCLPKSQTMKPKSTAT
jgi:hypothetical protein